MDSALIDQTSEQYLGQWKRLVSTTNWDKGEIIYRWREALIASGVPSSEYADEAWSQRVGNVTPQHVGRLRRAYERFGESRDAYPQLYWSHFQAALDWDDAEMWLEGAVQNDWSIAEMRAKRWETQGELNDEAAAEEAEAVAAPWDEDSEPEDASGDVVSGTLDEVHRAGDADAEEDEDAAGYDHSEFDEASAEAEERGEPAASAAAVRPFADLPSLPADVSDAFEAYKLSILRHKLAGWEEISCDDLLASLDSLKQLALAPA